MDGNTVYSTGLCCRGERGGKGFLVRGQHCCLWRICLPQGVFEQRARGSQFHSSLSLSTHQELLIFSEKKNPNPNQTKKSTPKQPTAHQPRWFHTRLSPLRSSCQYRDQPGLFRQLKSGLTSSPLEWIKECKKGENWEIF